MAVRHALPLSDQSFIYPSWLDKYLMCFNEKGKEESIITYILSVVDRKLLEKTVVLIIKTSFNLT